ncbi:hypothetical protein [Mesobacterium pallidum]|uniref:hypothetical protein n=1 Tax=Mesobacterium pallidum TaxID=2872037 RepID=UPI001EE2EC77|nr:hypothetical protein [Mesobacterium pallidum]
MKRGLLIPTLLAGLTAFDALAQVQVEPVYDIWDPVLGQPVAMAPDGDVGAISCGTNGGPPGKELASFQDFMACRPEPSGLREVEFGYDDEQDYIARALESEFKFLKGGTSVFAHPVIVSLLVDEEGLVQGRRIVTDDRATDMERRTAVSLMGNFKARYGTWSLVCEDIPMKEGEQPVGNRFTHEVCTGTSPDGTTRIAIEASYLRKKGQRGLSQETQEVNKGYFESRTRYEEVLAPHVPTTAP